VEGKRQMKEEIKRTNKREKKYVIKYADEREWRDKILGPI
jgi:hypothetical protein